jgi:hypothetical protein
MKRLRRRVREEGGMTLTELAITSALLLVVSGTFLTVVESLSRSIGEQQERSNNNDQARAAVEQLDREIRSGNVLYDPAAESPANYALRIYTQANATTRTPSFLCVQWRIDDRELIRRTWPPHDPANASGWRIIATDVVNVDQGVPAFALDPDPAKAGRTVDITLLVNSDPEESNSPTIRIQTSLTGRNTSFGFPLDVCNPAPAG